MPGPVPYVREVYTDDAARISFGVTGPAFLGPTGEGERLVHQAEQAAVYAASKTAKRRAVAAYSPQIIKQAWVVSVHTSPDLAIQVTNDEPLLAMVDLGTRPHAIFPRYAQSLMFATAGGTTVHAAYVNHPGTAGKRRVPGLAADLADILQGQLERRVGPLLNDDAFEEAGNE